MSQRHCQCGKALSASNRSGVCHQCTTSKTCPDCGCRISYRAERCRIHANAVINVDPANRARKSAAMQAKFTDPAYRAQHLAATREGTAALMRQPGEREKRREIGRMHGARNIGATHAPEVRARAGRAISATKLRDIPSEYRGFYRELKQHGYTAAERRDMVEERRARDEAEAPTVVANHAVRQRLRAAREKAQAY